MFERFLETLLDSIISFRDYFIIKQHITLSEATLLVFSLSRVIWPLIFGFVPANAVPNPVLVSPLMTALFLVLGGLHIGAFFVKDLFYRIAIVCGYAFIWLVLSSLIALTTIESVGVPTFFILSMLSIFIAVRLINERTVIK